MCLNLPQKRNIRLTDQVALELGFPSLNELKKRKRVEHEKDNKNDYKTNKETNNFCMLIEEVTPESTFQPLPNIKPKVKGQLKTQIVAEVSCKPSNLGDTDLNQLSRLSADEQKQMLLTEDYKRESIKIEEIDHVIMAPGLLRLGEEVEAPREMRVSLTQERLLKEVTHLFQVVKDWWRVEEIANRLDHPKEPINRLLK